MAFNDGGIFILLIKEYVRSNTVNCPLIYRPDTIMFTLANVTGMLVEYVNTNTVNCAHIYMLMSKFDSDTIMFTLVNVIGMLGSSGS